MCRKISEVGNWIPLVRKASLTNHLGILTHATLFPEHPQQSRHISGITIPGCCSSFTVSFKPPTCSFACDLQVGHALRAFP